jgi:hypothetical protein
LANGYMANNARSVSTGAFGGTTSRNLLKEVESITDLLAHILSMMQNVLEMVDTLIGRGINLRDGAGFGDTGAVESASRGKGRSVRRPSLQKQQSTRVTRFIAGTRRDNGDSVKIAPDDD